MRFFINNLTIYSWLYLPSQERILKKHFTGLMDPLPRVIDLIHDVKLVLLNSHPLCQCPRAHVPNSIEVGGMHLKTSEEQIHPVSVKLMSLKYFLSFLICFRNFST